MRTTIAPATITPVILMSGTQETGYSPAGGTGGAVGVQQYTAAPTNSIVTSDGLAVTIAAGQKAFLQNWDDAAVYVRCGALATTSNANFILKAGTAANDGNGGSVEINDFVGQVFILAATGSPRVNVSLYT